MNKEYYEAMNSLKPASDAVEKAVSAAIRAERESKVTELERKNRRGFFKPVSAIAASLAVVLALGAVFLPGLNRNSRHSFFLTASAASTATADEADLTLNKSRFVTIGALAQESGGMGTDNGIITEASLGMISTLKCTGKDVESVTYSVSGKNPYAAVRLAENTPVLSCKNKSYVFSGKFEGRKSADGKLLGIRETMEEGKCIYCDSVTFDYNNQSEPGLELEKVFTSEDNAVTAEYLKYDELDNRVASTDKAKAEKAVLDFYNLMFKDLRLEVTAKFRDGSSETQTLMFEAKNDTSIVKHRTENNSRSHECYCFNISVCAKIAD